MPTSPTPQTTDFTLDIIGRYTYNGLIDEALPSADPTNRPDARPFDIIVIGGGTFGAVLAQHVFHNDSAHSHRVLVLDAGRHVLPEHVQNLPLQGLDPPPAVTVDPGTVRNEVWGLPWRSDDPKGFPGLAYCVGGRSIFFGGWSPQLLDAETASWPPSVVTALRTSSAASPSYFRQACEQIGTNVTNDYIHGSLHTALRQRLFDVITANQVANAIPLAELPLHLDEVPAGEEDLHKLEAPLAVQARPPRSGYFPFNKFSSVPLLMGAARAAQLETDNDNTKKRLMVVVDCHVTRLVAVKTGASWRVTGVETSKGLIPVRDGCNVVIALGTIESTRLVQLSFPDLPNRTLIGTNLMGHLRSNLTIRIPRAALPGGLPAELQASTLFVKGRHTRPDGSVGHFHLQITAAGLEKPSSATEPELFKKVPDIDTLAAFQTATDNHVVVTIRGIGEMEPHNPSSAITLTGLDEFSQPRAFVTIKASAGDLALWQAMDLAADDVAKALANGQAYEVLTGAGYRPVAAGQVPSTITPFAGRQDGLGTTHHEAGSLWMGDAATTSVTDTNGRLHHVTNAYVAGPAVFPTIGSPNPMLTGVALTRRLGDHLAPRPAPYTPADGFTPLFDGISTDRWRIAGKGRFIVVDGALESVPDPKGELGLYWCTTPTPANFVLRIEWRRTAAGDNSGVSVRFPHPDSKGYVNTPWVASHFGFEVQIDEFGRPDGLPIHKTGAIYDQAGQILTLQPEKPVGEWNEYEIRVEAQTYTVRLNGAQVAKFEFVVGADPAHPDRGLPSTPAIPRFVGLQAHTGRVAFRNIRIKDIGGPVGDVAVDVALDGETLGLVPLVRDRETIDAITALKARGITVGDK